MTPLNNLLEKNKKWADAITQEDPDFFSKLAKQQKPSGPTLFNVIKPSVPKRP